MKRNMSDRENESDEPPRRKRSRIAKPFQQLSLPMDAIDYGKDDTRHSKSQNTNKEFASSDDDDQFSTNTAGIIKKIRLVNFMCHSNFEISLNPRINFISGCNGSGKSAIQTGIVVGLGGSASKTNRSSKVDGLIKHGCNSGSVTIILSNCGKNAYKIKEYGNEIKIVRNITSTSSTYRIYNQWGKLVSSKKSDLDKILFQFRIQPNNPVSVLNQDMARNFLSSNKAEAKYSLFRKATSLEDAEETLVIISDEIKEQETRMESKQKAVQMIQEELDKMTKQMKLSNQLKLSKEQKWQIEYELAWSAVRDKKNDLEHLEQKCQEQLQIKHNLENEIQEIEENIRKHTEEKEKLEQSLVALQNENNTKEKQRKKLNDDYRKLRKSYEEKCTKQEQLDSRIQSKRSDATQLRRTLDNVERAEAEQKQKKEEAIVEIAQLKADLSEYEGQIMILNGEFTRLKQTAEHFYMEKKKKERVIAECRESIGNCERHIQSLKKSDNLSTYAPWMPTLVQKIEEHTRANKFSKPPRGPIGRYLKVKNEKWIYAIESNLGIGFLNSFYVNNSSDRQLLYRIMDGVVTSGRKPTVHCSTFQEQSRDEMLSRIETSHPSYSNMYRSMTISDTVVANFLIDCRNVQRTLLVDRSEDCRNFVSKDENIPRKCALILNPDADQYLPGFRIYANQDRSRLTKILQKSAAAHMRGLTQEIESKNEQIAREKDEMEICYQQHRHENEKLQQTSNEIAKVKSKIFETRRKIQEWNAVAEIEPPSLRAQIDELKDIETEIETLLLEKENLKAQKSEEGKNIKDLRTQLTAAADEDMLNQQTSVAREKENLDSVINRLRIKQGAYAKQIEEQNAKINNLNIRISDSQKELEHSQDQASQASGSERIETTRSKNEILADKQRLECFIQEAIRKLGGEAVEFETEFHKMSVQHKTFLKLFNELKELHCRLKKMNKHRIEIISKNRDSASSVIISSFQEVLNSRNYQGRILIDHLKRRLTIMLSPMDGGDAMMNTESLSGGEKSFSTVAFLMALWKEMLLPFYSMDEYDVFMDAINRKAITKLLMSFAQEKCERQFIFLTPLDVSIIDTGPHVQVHRIRKLQQQN